MEMKKTKLTPQEVESFKHSKKDYQMYKVKKR